MLESVLLEQIENKLVARFNRPEIRSPLSINVLEKLHAGTDNILIDQTIQTVIFTGTDNVFASGADLREIAKVNGDTAREFALRGQTLMTKIAAMPQTTIAAVNGFCFGGALDLALACDKRIASPNAIFSHPGANLGIITGWGGTQRLPRLVGEAKALEIFLTAKRVTAEEALDIGLIDKISENPLRESLANY
jgi:enoyl-CoA hydratase/carnithine racemase